MNTRFLRRSWPIFTALSGIVLARTAWRRSKQLHLQGKVVLITGGSRGLGLAIADAFAEEGTRLVLCAREPEELRTAYLRLSQAGAEVLVILCDVTQTSQVQQAIEQTLARFGQIDILVNNAGIISAGNWQAQTREDFEESMNTIFWGMYNMTMAVLPTMLPRKAGRIINITSIGGKVSVPHLLSYSSAKFAAVGFSEGLHTELARDGIIVTTVAPGLMRTGSQINTVMKGEQHRAEYTLFTLMDTLPATSISVRRAAKQIVRATKLGTPELIISIQAQILSRFHGAFPGLSIELLSLANRFLPVSQDTKRHMGHESETSLSQSPLTLLGHKAAEDYNEKPQPNA